ncbi:carboxypeptidase B2 isoform X1 [Polypterus senegalus]|uniref:carboxypeptidase B2 isoform X1 n=2 Tax=Polypterus senegalus TaxID=55291 RepID=UPI0019660F4C|nr:carboxypeptidase B2 isoform X1 [Polypterus senegalus]
MEFYFRIVLLAFLCFENGIFTTTSRSDQVLSIIPETEADVEIVKNIARQNQTALWHPDSFHHIKPHTDVHMYFNISSVESVKALLSTNGIKHSVLVEDVQELIEVQTKNISTDPRSSTGSFYEQYHPLEEIYSWIDRTTQWRPDLVQTILIGSTFEKHPLYVLKLSGKGTGPKKAMWMDCGIHAREWISPTFCIWFIQYHLQFYDVIQSVTNTLDNMDIYVLPVMNPDGYSFTWNEDRMWRKNRAKYDGTFCIGTDLNRNFDANWCTEGASANPCDSTYCGPFPESELETKAVAQFLRRNKHTIKLYISIHSYSQMLLFPYSYTMNKAENHEKLNYVAYLATTQMRRHHKTNFVYGPGAKTIYLAPGGSDDWAYDLGIPYSYTFELRDKGRYGFLLPPSMIKPACLEVLTAIQTITSYVIDNVK